MFSCSLMSPTICSRQRLCSSPDYSCVPMETVPSLSFPSKTVPAPFFPMETLDVRLPQSQVQLQQRAARDFLYTGHHRLGKTLGRDYNIPPSDSGVGSSSSEEGSLGRQQRCGELSQDTQSLQSTRLKRYGGGTGIQTDRQTDTRILQLIK